MGYADQLFYYMSENYGHYANILAGIVAGLLLLLYLLDVEHWSATRGGAFLLYPATLVLAAATWVYILLIADVHPYGQICLFALLNPAWLLLVKSLFYPKVAPQTFVSWLSGPFLLVSCLVGTAWAAWVFWDEEHEWNTETRIEAAQETGCAPDFETYPDCRADGVDDDEPCFHIDDAATPHKANTLVFPDGCDDICVNVYNNCLNGVLPWVGPLFVAVILLFLSFCSTFLRSDGTSKGDMINFGKVWIFIVVALWITSIFAGTAGGAVMPALAALTLASFMGAVVFVSVSISKEKQRANAQKVWDSIDAKYGKNFDWARGLLVLLFAPLFLVYLPLSMANQAVRRCGAFPCSQPARDTESGEGSTDVLTKRTRSQITTFQSWDRTKVFTCAIYLGFAVISLQVLVSKLVTLFLSWLIDATKDMNLGILTGIIAGVAIGMFLIPGIPVYLTVGIVLPAKAYEAMGWPLAMLYASAVALVLKLASSALQQKAIGESLSGYVKVRQAVAINSPLVKSMKLILGAKGLTIAKVGVLVGGPDWPTSVLCGILKLELIQIVIGTIPVIFVILPTCVSGALLYMSGMVTDNGNPQYVWASSVAMIVTALSTVIQFGALLIATFYIEYTTSSRTEELALIPVDKEVKDADEGMAAFHRCYGEVTRWHVLPIWCKITLQASLLCIIVSSYMSLLFSSACFEVHALTDTIEENLGGTWHNIVKPLGWVVLGLFVTAVVFLKIFTSWGKRQAVEKLSKEQNFTQTVDDANTPLLKEELGLEAGTGL